MLLVCVLYVVFLFVDIVWDIFGFVSIIGCVGWLIRGNDWVCIMIGVCLGNLRLIEWFIGVLR